VAAATRPRRRPRGIARRDRGAHAGRAGLRHLRRHPGDVLRVLLGGLVVTAGGLAARHGHVFAFDTNLFRLVNQLPDALGRPLLTVMQLGALAAVPVVAAVALAARRPRLARDLALSGVLAWALAKLVNALVGRARPVALRGGVVVRGLETGLGYPSGHAAVAAALATAAGPWLPRPARRATWWAVWLVALGRIYDGVHLPLDVLGGVALGWALAAAVHLALGAPGGLPTTAAILTGLRAAGIEPLGIRPLEADARGSVPFVVGTSDGQRLFVKTVGREQRDADLLHKLWRWAAYREVEDETPFATPKQAVEHEAYMGLLAARAGVRTPAVLTAAPTGDGHVLLVSQHVAGQTLDRLGTSAVDDRLLAAVWAEVGRLRAAGIAHRDLRGANLLVDGDRRPWLLDFGFAEAAASHRSLAGDVAELLVSLACLVGADRALRSATQAIGTEAVAQALPLLQPAALAAATRADLKAHPSLLAELRQRAAAAAGTEPPPIEPVTRVRLATVLVLVAGGFAVHLLLPQVAQLPQTLNALHEARWAWLAVGLVLAAASYPAAAVAQLGAVDPPLALGPATLVQVASSFANRLTPASLGGIGLNVRWLQRSGLDRSTSMAAVAVNTAAGVLVHVLGLLLAVALLGRTSTPTAHVPRGWPALVGLVAVLAAGGLLLWSPLGRRRLLDPTLQAGRELAGVLRRPDKAAQLLGGSAAITLTYALALACCLAAFDAHLPLAGTVAVFLAATAVASISPTPGGLGAMEAALVAGLTAIGAAAGPAVAGVLAFRLLTFWLPILPGWLAYRTLRANGTL
ncbi:MAG TPA: lysylphosphatidylglycerol synthase domain-containing protein, partial [Actinomycetes bacterium]